MINPRIKAAANAILPRGVADFIKGCRCRGTSAHLRYVLKLRKYRSQFAKANAAAPSSTIVLPSGCRIVIPSDPDIRDAFEHFGWKDPEMVDEFAGFMKLASGKKTLWDVGALFGVFSFAFALADPSRRSLAFEPNPVSRGKLEECARLNPAAKVDAFGLAVGLSGEVVEFERGFHFTAVAGLETRPSAQNLTQTGTVSIDELVGKNFSPPDLIKIDVEGHEWEVLQGAKQLLQSCRPSLSIEIHPGLLAHKGTSGVAIADYLETAGYVFYDTQLIQIKKDYFARRDNFRVFAM
jgi:FkbM family methyltransferase